MLQEAEAVSILVDFDFGPFFNAPWVIFQILIYNGSVILNIQASNEEGNPFAWITHLGEYLTRRYSKYFGRKVYNQASDFFFVDIKPVALGLPFAIQESSANVDDIFILESASSMQGYLYCLCRLTNFGL